MKQFLGLILFLVWSIIAPATNSYAHTVHTSGSISAILHIAADDDPIVGEPTRLIYTIKDANRKFSAEKCECKVEISTNGTVIENKLLSRDNNSEQSLDFTFKQKGIYTITLSGSARDNSFEQFQIKNEIRVSRENANSSIMNLIIAYLPISAPIAAAVAYTVVLLLGGKKESKLNTEGVTP